MTLHKKVKSLHIGHFSHSYAFLKVIFLNCLMNPFVPIYICKALNK